MNKHSYVRALAVAGSDSSGGAGIQADLKTFSTLGVYGMTVITALTAQNTVEVRSISEVSADFVGDQLDAVLSDIGVDAVKIGMLFDSPIIEVVADRITKFGITKVVLDPVMVAKSGDQLLKTDAVDVLKTILMPRVEILTPNLPEAELLLSRALVSSSDIANGARELTELGPVAVLLKGGHANDPHFSRDCLVVRSGREFLTHWLESPRVTTVNTHGTGCTLSAAICAYRAKGQDLVTAVENGKRYLTHAIQSGARITLGRGHVPVDHLIYARASSNR